MAHNAITVTENTHYEQQQGEHIICTKIQHLQYQQQNQRLQLQLQQQCTKQQH